MVMRKMPGHFARGVVRVKPNWPKAKSPRQSKKDVQATRSTMPVECFLSAQFSDNPHLG